jgi:hypothetical protein
MEDCFPKYREKEREMERQKENGQTVIENIPSYIPALTAKSKAQVLFTLRKHG